MWQFFWKLFLNYIRLNSRCHCFTMINNRILHFLIYDLFLIFCIWDNRNYFRKFFITWLNVWVRTWCHKTRRFIYRRKKRNSLKFQLIRFLATFYILYWDFFVYLTQIGIWNSINLISNLFLSFRFEFYFIWGNSEAAEFW